MAIHIRDEATSRAVRELARVAGVGLTEAVRMAAEAELARRRRDRPLHERLRAIAEAIPRRPEAGLPADKAFYDSLYEEGDGRGGGT